MTVKYSDFEKSVKESRKHSCIECKYNGLGWRSYGWRWCEKPDAYTGAIPTVSKSEKNYNGECRDFQQRMNLLTRIKQWLRR